MPNRREGPSEFGGYSGLVQPTSASPGRKLDPAEEAMIMRQIDPTDETSTIADSELLQG